MDLGAYTQIEELENIAKDNGIEVPRLRGYRLMKEESKITLLDVFDGIDISCVERLCEAEPFWSNDPEYWEISDYTNYLKHFFIEYDK